MTSSAALSNWLRLTLISGIGGETQRKLLAAFGLPEVIFSLPRSEVRSVFGEKITGLLFDTDASDKIDIAVAWSKTPDQYIITLADPEYPQALLEIPDPPSVLYVRGRVGLLNQRALAMVGSRTPTPQGIQNAEKFASAFAETGLVITSGLALGIDAAAHRGALAVGGNTLAFIGTGIDRIYPARNRELALEIGAKGAIVSELPIGTPVTAANFPRRNRMISGISCGVLVIEAAMESGSLITARLAAEQGREVFAIPGSIHSPQSRGCHKLIKQGAKLVETANDVLDELHWQFPHPVSASTVSNIKDENDLFLSLMGYDPCGFDELVERSTLTTESLMTKLLELELAGDIASLPGGRYQRLLRD